MPLTTFEIWQEEHSKYSDCWQSGEYPQSKLQSILPFIFDKNALERIGYWLDIGCGNCALVAWLREHGVKALGVDITSAGWRELSVLYDWLYEAPIWQLPFSDNMFNVTLSLTVLEHLPEALIDACVKEIVRVTKPGGLSRHWVSTKHKVEFRGHDLHTALHPIGWWVNKFNELGSSKFELIIKEKDNELCDYTAKYGRKPWQD